MKKKLLLIGGGGHCHSVLDSVLLLGTYDEIGIIDTMDNSYLGIPVVGKDEDIPKLVREGWGEAFVTVGSIGDTRKRRHLYEMIRQNGLIIPSIIDSTAVVAKDVKIGQGVFVGKHAVINSGVTIGTCSIVNTGAIIEHDCEIDSFSHVSTGSILCGQVRIGSDTHVGAGTVVKNQLKIGKGSLIGAGSVVIRNIPDKVKAYGCPCKVVEKWEYI